MSLHSLRKVRGLARGRSRRARRGRSLGGGWLALEPRTLLATRPLDVMIGEFLASNGNGIKDNDGDSSDWIELYNPTTTAVDLTGWTLTDDAVDPQQWTMPAVTLGAGQFLVVYASGKNRAVAGQPLHTNFKISASAGGYLGLYRPDGTLADDYTNYPQQLRDLSYGHSMGTAVLVGGGSAATYQIPTSGSLGTTWKDVGPVSGTWLSGATGLGYGVSEPGFTVRYVQSKVELPDLTTAKSVLGDASKQQYTATEHASVVNYLDTGTVGNFGNDNPFPSLSIGTDQDWFAIEATGKIQIPAAGNWTFGVNSDDGFELILSKGAVQFRMAYEGLRGTADTLGTFNLPEAGEWTATLVAFENGGGASAEFFAAQGSKGSFDSTFRLVGDTAGGLTVSSAPADTTLMTTNLQPAMQGVNATAYVRIPFTLTSTNVFDTLALRMNYDDGFVAYLNGVEVARRNAPTTLAWNSRATLARTGTDVLTAETFSLTDRMNVLRAGDNLLAIQILNITPSDGDVLAAPELVGTTIDEDGASFFAKPTPGNFNATPYGGMVADVTASVDRGFFTTSFPVTLATTTPGTAIYYTTDGSAPVAGVSQLYTGPITISKTTVLKATGFRSGWLASQPRANTYLFLADVIQQTPESTIAAGFPAQGDVGVTVDYGMDPNLVNDPVYGGANLINALKAIPTISISTDLSNLWDPNTGIYTNPYGKGDYWEKPASVELVNADGSAEFQINAGLRIRGGYSRDTSNPKHAFRLFFNTDYEGNLKFPLFGSEGVSDFAKVDLRTDQNYSWSFGGDGRHTAVRDVFSRDTQAAMGDPYTRSRYYHLYIDGVYWGMYQTQERAEANYAASYFGGDADNYDVVKVENYSYEVYATDGNLDAWQRLYNAAIAGFSTNAAYYRVQGLNPDGTRNASFENLVDIDNLIDYMQVILFTGNFDAPISEFLGNDRPNNFYAIRDRTGGSGGFKFFAHDNEHTLLDVNKDRNGPWPAGSEFRYFNPQYLHQQLMANAEYRLRFADRVRRNFFNDGALTTSATLARFQKRANEIAVAILGEAARWGDSKREPAYTPGDWQNAINDVVVNYLPYRTDIVLNQFRNNGLYPSLAAPGTTVNGVAQHGGRVTAGAKLRFTSTSGSPVYYMLDGTDPRLIGGGINPNAKVFNPSSSPDIVLNATVKVAARAFNGTTWSALDASDLQVNVPASAANLSVTEVNYNPYPAADTSIDKELYEFIELRNDGPIEIDLTGVKFTVGITYDFTTSSVRYLAPGAYLVVAKDLARFRERYGSAPVVAGTFGGNLSNGGEEIKLVDALGQTIVDFTYDDDGTGWYPITDGGGKSLVAIAPRGNLNQAASWRASVEQGGSPGRLGNTAPDLTVPATQNINEDTQALDLPIAVADAETAVGSLTVTVTTDNPTLFPAGSVVLRGSGGSRLLDLIPAADKFGSATVTVTVKDAGGAITTKTFVINVASVDDPPVARPDSYTGVEDTALVVPVLTGLLANDTDPDSATTSLRAVLVAGPTSGVLNLATDGSFDYTPAADFWGDVTFTYAVSDGTITSAPVTVTIQVQPVNDPPVARADSYTMNEDETLVVPAVDGVKANDFDIDSSSFTAALVAGPVSGVLNLAADGSFTYRPLADFYGTVTFTYRLNDGTATSDTATVTILVKPVNDAPTGIFNQYETVEDTPIVVSAVQGVLSNDGDIDSTLLSSLIQTMPHLGTVLLDVDGSFVYTPIAQASGIDWFTYVVSDGELTSQPIYAVIHIQGVNDLPVLAAVPTQTVDEGTSLEFRVQASDVETGPDGLTYALLAGAPEGMTIDARTGVVRWTPRQAGTTTVGVMVSDAAIPPGSSTTAVTIQVRNVAPRIEPASDLVVNVGVALAQRLTFVDPGMNNWTASVDYGDGTGRQSLAVGADRSIELSHVYGSVGTYTAQVWVDDGSAVATESFVVKVAESITPPIDPGVTQLESVTAQVPGRAVKGFLLQFSGPLNAATAKKRQAYTLTSAGRDGRFGTRDDVALGVKSASLDSSGKGVLLTPMRLVAPGTKFRVTVAGAGKYAVLDQQSRAVDGDRDGQAGGTATLVLSVPMAQATLVTAEKVSTPWSAELRGFRALKSSRNR